jgi:hypothetical protein
VIDSPIALDLATVQGLTMESHGRDGLDRLIARRTDGDEAVTHHYTTPTVHEMTPSEIQRQRQLVRMSLSSAPWSAPRAAA